MKVPNASMATLEEMNMEQSIQAPDSKREYNIRLFRVIAPRYDFITRALSLCRDHAWKQALIRMLPDLPAPSCLDLACGTGDVCRQLAVRYPQGHISGMDLSAEMLQVAKEATPDGSIHYWQGDMTALDEENESVDIVTGSYALRNAPKLSMAINEVARVLKPGGVAGFLDFSKSSSPAAQSIGYWVLRLWGSFWGVVVHGNADVYAYIAESLKTYPDRTALERLFARHGLVVQQQKTFYFGLLQAITVKKMGQCYD